MSSGERRLLEPAILIPFILITMVWGSTWIVIRDQLGVVPPTWSVTYRFAIASVAMFAYALATRAPLRIGRTGHALAFLVGIPQFVLNFNFVYAAEHHVTSGLVAVVFALLLVPNTVFGWLFLKHRITGTFLFGSGVAMGGVALLFAHELGEAGAQRGAVLLGIGLTLAAVLSASVANVAQASEALKSRPIAGMLAWSMVYGVIGNALIASLLYGPPVVEPRAGYWLGLIYLGLFASAIAFTLYFGIIRAIGPGPAAHSSVILPVIAMGLSTIFEGYRWTLTAAGGGVLVLAGLLLALRSNRTEVLTAAPD